MPLVISYGQRKIVTKKLDIQIRFQFNVREVTICKYDIPGMPLRQYEVRDKGETANGKDLQGLT
jgi:hypothetical protein